MGDRNACFSVMLAATAIVRLRALTECQAEFIRQDCAAYTGEKELAPSPTGNKPQEQESKYGSQ